MTIYILQPHTNPIKSLSLKSAKFTADARKKQINEVTKLWMDDQNYQNIRDWVVDAKARGIIKTASNTNEPDISGTVLVDISDESIEQMQSELTSVTILRDEPIELIEPRKNLASVKREVTEEDLWHLGAINLQNSERQQFNFTGKDVTIAVFDTGVDESHSALQGKVVESYSLDIRRIRNLGEADPLDISEDFDGHGTHVAGLICGRRIGVAPDAKIINAILIPNPRMGNSGFFSNFSIGMQLLSNKADIDIVNISAGVSGSTYLEVMDRYLNTLLAIGILPICAIGNEGRNNTRSPGNCRKAISVGATNFQNKVAGFSSYGTIVYDSQQYNVPSLVAPGEAVYSSVMGGQYEAWNGTSMAAPIVSGIAALILEEYPDMDVWEMTEELLSRCNPINGLLQRQGAGLIRVRRQ
jgi:subtilisin family serine protease